MGGEGLLRADRYAVYSGPFHQSADEYRRTAGSAAQIGDPLAGLNACGSDEVPHRALGRSPLTDQSRLIDGADRRQDRFVVAIVVLLCAFADRRRACDESLESLIGQDFSQRPIEGPLRFAIRPQSKLQIPDAL